MTCQQTGPTICREMPDGTPTPIGTAAAVAT